MTSTPTAAHRAALGRGLRDVRAERGLTLRDLADLLEVSPATLSAIENGRTGVTTDRVQRLAAVLDVSVDRLFGQAAGSGAEAPSLPVPSSEPRHWRTFAPLLLDPALDGALLSFVDLGYHGAPMRTIAERANLSVPGLYHYYASKQEMLVALLDLTMSDLGARCEAARSEGSDPVERFALVVECLALYHTHRRELGLVGASEMRSLEPEARERLTGLRRDVQHLVDADVDAAVEAGLFLTTQPHEAARAVVTMCTALAQWFRADGPEPAEHVARQYVDFALDLVRWVGRTPS
ncbi:helix-turn-helix domain-containing protein [Nocardioides psychrotolerans]|uniref:helix-turn-helix domain-containing protein n=1 Tax=Nocardioides psychrotolerans TaxID=1005945 RepID=UPI0031382438